MALMAMSQPWGPRKCTQILVLAFQFSFIGLSEASESLSASPPKLSFRQRLPRGGLQSGPPAGGRLHSGDLQSFAVDLLGWNWILHVCSTFVRDHHCQFEGRSLGRVDGGLVLVCTDPAVSQHPGQHATDRHGQGWVLPAARAHSAKLKQAHHFQFQWLESANSNVLTSFYLSFKQRNIIYLQDMIR